MPRFIGSLMLVFGLVAAIGAQSGRKIAPAPTPEPVMEKEAAPAYSESKPAARRPASVYPRVRPPVSEELKTQPKPDLKPQTVGDAEEDVVRIDTSLITIPVSVFDRNGLYIPNLKAEEFQIFEDGVPQEIAYFATSEKPFTVVLLLDTSPSTEFKIEEIQTAAISFVDHLKPQDSVMVIEFDGNVNVLTEATRDRQRIYKAIKKADFGGGTSLYEAVDFALRKRLARIEGRKAIVLFTDGVDTTSYKADYDGTLREAEESETLIFPIYYNTYSDLLNGGGAGSPFPTLVGGTTRREYALGRQYLQELSEATGGRVFNAENTAVGLTAAFEGIAEELRRQYSIGYYPPESGRTGERRQIKVRVNRPHLVIRARDSYVVGAKP